MYRIRLAGAAIAASMASTCLVQTPAMARPVVANFVTASALWVANGRATQGASELLGVLRRAQLDGLDSGPALAARAETLLSRAQAGDARAAIEADQLLSTAWVRYF